MAPPAVGIRPPPQRSRGPAARGRPGRDRRKAPASGRPAPPRPARPRSSASLLACAAASRQRRLVPGTDLRADAQQREPVAVTEAPPAPARARGRSARRPAGQDGVQPDRPGPSRGPAGSGSGCPAVPATGPGRPAAAVLQRPGLQPRCRGRAMASRTGATRTAAASATRRTAAARSWPPVIAQPIMTAFFTMARACGRRSAS